MSSLLFVKVKAVKEEVVVKNPDEKKRKRQHDGGEETTLETTTTDEENPQLQDFYKKQSLKKEKQARKLKIQQELYRLSLKQQNQYDIIMGLDFSYQTPGLTLQYLATGETWCYFVPRRKREQKLEKIILSESNGKKKKITLRAFPEMPPPASYSCREARFDSITALILNTLDAVKVVCGVVDDTRICCGYEAMPFSILNSSSVSGSFECGGVMRNKLYRRGIHLVEISVASNKQVFTGDGRADKFKMIEAWEKIYQLPCLYHLLGMEIVNENSDTKPAEDIVDSYSLLNCLVAQ